ncbi:MAG: hypothetical protein RLZZ24_1948 [Pseudomonadota bacterium]
MTTCPAILIAAPASGQGKTTVTAALARLHARQGRRVTVFKCGPDFLDPGWHALASGQPVYQMDLWMTGEDDVRRRLHTAAMQSDSLIVEGVMGLFDGSPSAADLAEKFGIPVLAVIDASAMAGTFGALAYGLRHYRPELPWAGVLANRVASERHAEMLREGTRDAGDWLGALMRHEHIVLPHRHLGLTLASDMPDALTKLDAAADALSLTPLGQMRANDWQRWAVRFDAPAPALAVPARLQGRTIAVARDAAFCFIYQANLDTLQSLGAKLVFFSPLRDAALPACDALWLPGGYPELHADVLQSNTSMAQSVRDHAAAAKPIWAECGGMMVLFDALEQKDGTPHTMWGVLPGRTVMQTKLAKLGPQQLDAADGALRGHTFHFSLAHTPLKASRFTHAPGKPDGQDEAFYQQGNVRASYFHPWFASAPLAAAALFLPQEAP